MSSNALSFIVDKEKVTTSIEQSVGFRNAAELQLDGMTVRRAPAGATRILRLRSRASEALSEDLSFLESILWFRMTLSARLCEASSRQDEAVASILSSEASRQLVEFLFLLKTRGVQSADHIEALAISHNAYLVGLSKDPAKMKRMGIKPDKLIDAMFTGDILPRLKQQWKEKPGAIDQSNVARLLFIAMSTETCRKVLVTFAQSGFLSRDRTSYGNVLVVSTGIAEWIFGKTLREARLNCSSEAQDSDIFRNDF